MFASHFHFRHDEVLIVGSINPMSTSPPCPTNILASFWHLTFDEPSGCAMVESAQVIPITCWLNSFEFGQVLSSTSMSLFWFFFQVRVGRGSVVYHTSFNVYFVTAYMWLRSPHCLWQCCWGTYWPFVVFFQSPLSLSGLVIPKAVGWLKWIIMTRFGVVGAIGEPSMLLVLWCQCIVTLLPPALYCCMYFEWGALSLCILSKWLVWCWPLYNVDCDEEYNLTYLNYICLTRRNSKQMNQQ